MAHCPPEYKASSIAAISSKPIFREYEPSRRISGTLLVFSIICLVQLAGLGVASADRVDKLVGDLTGSDSFKVRLAAASSLSKIDDPRATDAMIDALGDSESSIRSVAADSLGKKVGADTDKAVRNRAIKALEKAKKDKSQLVRKQAEKALAAIDAATSTPSGGIYVDIGPMAAKAGDTKQMQALIRKTVAATFKSEAPSMATVWPGGKAPTAKQLQAAGSQGFHVDGTLVSLDTQAKGSATVVSCKISMLIATFPKKSIFGFLDGKAGVQASSSASDIESAKVDCVAAVVEDLVAKKIIPAIQNRAP